MPIGLHKETTQHKIMFCILFGRTRLYKTQYDTRVLTPYNSTLNNTMGKTNSLETLRILPPEGPSNLGYRMVGARP